MKSILSILGGMFVIQGGTYAFTAPMWGYLCDKVIDPRLATLIGSGLITVTFLFLGPVSNIENKNIAIIGNSNLCFFKTIIH